MRKITIIIAALTLIFTVGCKNNDDKNTPNYELTLNNTSYSLLDGSVQESGAVDLINTGSETHFEFDLLLSDSEFVVYSDDTAGEKYFIPTDGVSFVFFVELNTPTDSDIAGTYTYVDGDTATLADVEGKFVFTVGGVNFDEDGIVEEDGDIEGDEFDIVSGTITITGSKPNYTIEFDVMVMEDDVPGPASMFQAVGNYTGKFQYLEK